MSQIHDQHLTQLHRETLQVLQGLQKQPLDLRNPAALDRLALIARTASAACEALAMRAEGQSTMLLEASE